MKTRGFRSRVYQCYRSNASGDAGHLRKRDLSQYHRRWSKFLPSDKTAPILDIGCGGGEFLYFLKQQGFTDLQGIDVSPEQVEIARGLGLSDVELSDGQKYLENTAKCFQVIAAFSVLEHLTRDEMFTLLDRIVAALRPGGLFLAVVPNSLSPFGCRVRYADVTHEQSFTPRSILQILGVVGLEPLAILERGPIVHGGVSLMRWLVWQSIRGLILVYRVAQSADYRWRVYTEDMRLVARKQIVRGQVVRE